MFVWWLKYKYSSSLSKINCMKFFASLHTFHFYFLFLFFGFCGKVNGIRCRKMWEDEIVIDKSKMRRFLPFLHSFELKWKLVYQPLYRNKIILMRFYVEDDKQNQRLFSVYLTRFELNRPNKSDFNIIKSAFFYFYLLCHHYYSIKSVATTEKLYLFSVIN